MKITYATATRLAPTGPGRFVTVLVARLSEPVSVETSCAIATQPTGHLLSVSVQGDYVVALGTHRNADDLYADVVRFVLVKHGIVPADYRVPVLSGKPEPTVVELSTPGSCRSAQYAAA